VGKSPDRPALWRNPMISVRRASLADRPIFILMTPDKIEVFDREPSPNQAPLGELFSYDGTNWRRIR